MFAAGWASGGRDRYDTGSALYRDIAAMAALRREHRVFSRGVPRMLHASAAQPGALAWTMRYGRQTALVVFNSADHEALLPSLQLGSPAGSRWQGLYALGGTGENERPAPLVPGASGRVTLRLPPRSAQVCLVQASSGRAARVTSQAAAASLRMGRLANARVGGDFTVGGTAQDAQQLRLVVDGDLAVSSVVDVRADGRWQAGVDTSRMVDAGAAHSVTAWVEGAAEAVKQEFRVDRRWKLAAAIIDPAGDDLGPDDRYLYPSDSGWGANRQMDLRGVKVNTAGGALRLELAMHRVTQAWNPTNGFDHVAFTAFIELPGRDGGATMRWTRRPSPMRWAAARRARPR